LLDAGNLKSGRGLPQSKAAAPRTADGLSAFQNRTCNTTGIIMFLSEEWCPATVSPAGRMPLAVIFY
jgi:hypothetical protein